jgi:hypothetical protein
VFRACPIFDFVCALQWRRAQPFVEFDRNAVGMRLTPELLRVVSIIQNCLMRVFWPIVCALVLKAPLWLQAAQNPADAKKPELSVEIYYTGRTLGYLRNPNIMEVGPKFEPALGVDTTCPALGESASPEGQVFYEEFVKPKQTSKTPAQRRIRPQRKSYEGSRWTGRNHRR